MEFVMSLIMKFVKPRTRLWAFLHRQFDDALRVVELPRASRKYAAYLTLIPPARKRLTGSNLFSAYAYDIGKFAALTGEYVLVKDPRILDLGCGAGKGACAALPLLGENGHYYGLDISRDAIEFNQGWYPADKCSFIHASLHNAHYNPGGVPMSDYEIPLDDASIDLVYAISLFTHLDKPDSQRYFQELARLMKPGAIALLSFFVLEDTYDVEKYKGTRMAFDLPLPGQPEWFGVSRFKSAEAHMGVSRKGLDLLIGAEFELVRLVNGGWDGNPSAFLQDLAILRRK